MTADGSFSDASSTGARPTCTDWHTRFAVVAKVPSPSNTRRRNWGTTSSVRQSSGGRIPRVDSRGKGNAEKTRRGRAARRIHLHCRRDAAGCRCAASGRRQGYPFQSEGSYMRSSVLRRLVILGAVALLGLLLPLASASAQKPERPPGRGDVRLHEEHASAGLLATGQHAEPARADVHRQLRPGLLGQARLPGPLHGLPDHQHRIAREPA